jgi:hypothetical protein
MNSRVLSCGSVRLGVFVVAVLLLSAPRLSHAQRGQGGERGQGAPASGQASAPIDLTGYWVSLITDNWRFRMITPPKGDYNYLPINAEGRRVGDTWDPAKDEAAGNQCKGYGAVGIMRLPTRLHVTWEDPNTLRIDTDTGMQTRSFHFGPAPPPTGEPTWQGLSAARWESPGGRGGRGGRAGQGGQEQVRTGTLKVVTTQMKPGYLQKNGVPYSGNAVLTEYFTTLEDKGIRYLAVTTMLDDPQYLTQSFIRTSQFKFEPDGSKWNPTPCSAK